MLTDSGWKIPTGSPPPMRGKAVCPCFFQLGEGITPAYAGKSLASCISISVDGDHPRLCGEKPTVNAADVVNWGSPPPMRGKGPDRFRNRPHDGITPAYAGKSIKRSHVPSIRWDHPRLCGEKSASTSHVRKLWGSPPPMRGKVSLS